MRQQFFTRFNSNSDYFTKNFSERVQKISINTGYLCPNRDGTKGIGGCTYCNISSIKPNYAYSKKSVSKQMLEGVQFFSSKNKTQKYLAYFQSYTNTYQDYNILIKDYEEALNFPGVVGIIIATRPDCLPIEIIKYLSAISKHIYVSVELGIESTHEDTLKKINRCHTYADTIKAFDLLHEYEINSGGHIILGFPWESKDEMINHAKKISLLPLKQIKIHHLQVLKNTAFAKEYESNKRTYRLFNSNEYLDLIVEFLEHLRKDIVVQRFIAESPRNILIAPQWNGLRNRDFTILVQNRMEELNTFQGKYYFQ